MKVSVLLIVLVGAVVACTGSDTPTAVAPGKQSQQPDAPVSEARSDEMDSANSPGAGDSGREVWFNGRALDQAAIDQLTAIYAMAPQPGRWWYDAMSGLCGIEGEAAMGFMLPNHDFLGTLAEDASNGRSAVYINGRRLTGDEALFLSYFWQVPIQQGRYWLNGQGFTGIEGVPQAIGNIHIQAALLARQGRAQGGDNFWSSRLGAGNYDPASGAGYVSVPGHGPIGFGM